MESLTQPEEQRMARLQKYVDKVEEAQAEMIRAINSGEMEGFTEEQVRFHLSHNPNMLAEAGLFLAKMQRDYDYAKLDVDTITAELWRKCNLHKEDLGLANAKDRESYVKTQPEYIKAQQQLLEWKYRLAQMQIIYNRYENLFIGTRKIANLIERDNANNYRREKYE